MRSSDWSSDVCSSDLAGVAALLLNARVGAGCIAGRFHGPAPFLLAELGNRPSSRFLAHKLLDIAPECFKRRHDTSRRLAGGRDVSGNRERQDRKSVGWGKGVSVRVALGGRRVIKTKN